MRLQERLVDCETRQALVAWMHDASQDEVRPWECPDRECPDRDLS